MCCTKTKETAEGEPSWKEEKEDREQDRKAMQEKAWVGGGEQGGAGGRGAGRQERQRVDAFSDGNGHGCTRRMRVWWRRMLHKDTDEPSELKKRKVPNP